MPSDFTVNERPTTQNARIGVEQNPVIMIDDFLATPSELLEFACSSVMFGPPQNHYPGLRAQPLPQIYIANLIRAVYAAVGTAFSLPIQGSIDTNSYFGLATSVPETLSVLQRLPHFDTTSARQIAVLHYLCDETFGGTTFYRHRATGFESIDEERHAPYISRLKDELVSGGLPPARYMSGDDRLFEQVARFEAKFNRMLIYRSRALHSGTVNFAAGLSADPRRGRLTANVFLTYR
jgi:hypothetical protein